MAMHRRLIAAVLLVGLAPPAWAQTPTASLPELVKPLMLPAGDDTIGAWSDLDRDRAVKWGAGPTMLDKPSPDGNYFARPGQAKVAGRPVMVVASGARSGVMSIYIRDPTPPASGEAAAASFRQAGYGVTPARCPIDPRGAAPKRWYRLTAAGKRPAFLFVGPVNSGGQGYVLYLGDELPPMTQADAAAYGDNCSGKPQAPGAARPATGQAGVVAVIEALMRTAPPAAIPWTGLSAIPVVAWKSPPPMKMASPYTDGGVDANPRLLEGEFKTPTTRMSVLATGDDKAATRFSLLNGGNLPRGAVFDGLRRDGYALTALRCGKVYTQAADAWYRLTGPGKLPAILYRKSFSDGGRVSESYILRIDNVMPPIQPGQTAPAGGQCPG
jgi:hypothetical protein